MLRLIKFIHSRQRLIAESYRELSMGKSVLIFCCAFVLLFVLVVLIPLVILEPNAIFIPIFVALFLASIWFFFPRE